MLSNCSKFSIRYLTRIMTNDKSSVIGKTLSMLQDVLDVNAISSLTAREVKSNFCYFPIPEGEEWRVQISREIMSARSNKDIDIVGFQTDELNFMLSYICSH